MADPFKSFARSGQGLGLAQKVGQLFMPAVFINDAEREVQRMETLISEYCIGSLCFFHSRASAATNFEGKKKVVPNGNSLARLKELILRYQNAAHIPLLIAMDAEWGLAMRIENTPQYPYAITLGALQDGGLIQEVGRSIGLDCLRAGIHWNLAPVVDINTDPENPVIGYRSFGDNRQMVFSKSRAFIQGMSSVGTLHAIKHFPGHGDTAVDSHLGLPLIDKSEEELGENELFPFQRHIDLGVDAIMVGHLSLPQLDPSLPTTTSRKIVTDLLRTRMGFKGVVISDALNMHAVSKEHPKKGVLEAKAFEAGMDVLCFSEHPGEGIGTILKTADSLRVEESFQRVWALKQKAFSTEIPKNLEQPALPALHRALSRGSLTELYGDPALAQKIREGDFLNLSLGKPRENSFSQGLEQAYGKIALDLGADWAKVEESMDGKDGLLLAIFPPSAKPKDHFGLDERALGLIRDWVAHKNVLIYHFGNPYALDLLGLHPRSNVVLAYQDFLGFQQTALEHFKGNHRAVGRLPVKLKNFDP